MVVLTFKPDGNHTYRRQRVHATNRWRIMYGATTVFTSIEGHRSGETARMQFRSRGVGVVESFPRALAWAMAEALNSYFAVAGQIIDTDDLRRNFCDRVNLDNALYQGAMCYLIEAHTSAYMKYHRDLERHLAETAYNLAVEAGADAKFHDEIVVYLHLDGVNYRIEELCGPTTIAMTHWRFSFGPSLREIIAASGATYSAPAGLRAYVRIVRL